MSPEDVGALVEAARAHCEQHERWAHAEFYYHMGAGSRATTAAAGPYPWRGIMSPTLLHMIHVLEENDHYVAPSLPQGEPVAGGVFG